jgi:5-hydroxyisourate hydrolase
MSGISTHVLDTAAGRPARGVPVRLERRTSQGWTPVGEHATDEKGRVADLLGSGATLEPGTYRLHFDVTAYFGASGQESFFPEATVVFVIRDAAQHYHVPLLLSPFGYTTYRGS